MIMKFKRDETKEPRLNRKGWIESIRKFLRFGSLTSEIREVDKEKKEKESGVNTSNKTVH